MLETVRKSPLSVLIALFLFVTMGALGSISATLAQLCVLCTLPLIWNEAWRASLAGEPVLVAFLSAFLALVVAFVVSTQQASGALQGASFLAVVFAAMLFVYLRRFETSTLVNVVATTALAGVLLSLIVAAVQVWGLGFARAEGWASNANVLARVAILSGFVCLIGFRAKDWRRTSPFLLGPIVGVLVVVLSGSRGAFIALPVLILVSSIFFVTPHFQKKVPLLVWLLIGVVCVLGTMVFVSMSDRMLQMGATISAVLAGQSAGEAVDARIDMYGAGWFAFLASPIFGHGWSNIVGAANASLSPTAVSESLLGYRHLHSDFFNFAVGGGIVGLVAWGTFIFAPLAKATLFWPAKGGWNARYLLVLLPTSYLAFGLTDITFSYDILTVSYFFIIAIALSMAKPTNQNVS